MTFDYFFVLAHLLQATVGILGWIRLFTAHNRYKMEPVWWVAGIVTFGLAGYPAYFAAKKRYLENNDTGEESRQKEISTAGRLTIWGLIYLFITWGAQYALFMARFTTNGMPDAYGSYFFLVLTATVIFLTVIIAYNRRK